MIRIPVVLGSLALAACVTGYHPTYSFNQLQVLNLSGGTIAEVEMRVLESQKSLQCERVNKNAICNDYFGKRNYPQRGIELSWRHPDGSMRSETFNPPVPVTYYSAFPLRIVMQINADGTVKPFYEQDEPSRSIFDS